MRFNWPTGFRARRIWLPIGILSTLVVGIVATYRLFPRDNSFQISSLRTSGETLFNQQFPTNPVVQEEMQNLRRSGRLTEKNEKLIRTTVDASATPLEMPPSVLWCLLFQESRLNHLDGIESNAGALGLGQFSRYSFHEINNQLGKFDSRNIAMLTTTLGQDVRPIHPIKNDVYSNSSYFYIPTAVVASASYLNNRHAHLRKLLAKRGLRYHPELLWLYAVMAYNKGTKSVLVFWNTVQQRYGEEGLKAVLLDPASFLKLSRQEKLLTISLQRIWNKPKAKSYAKELAIHVDKINHCALKEKILLASQPMEAAK